MCEAGHPRRPFNLSAFHAFEYSEIGACGSVIRIGSLEIGPLLVGALKIAFFRIDHAELIAREQLADTLRAGPHTLGTEAEDVLAALSPIAGRPSHGPIEEPALPRGEPVSFVRAERIT